jgi:hypothetical protein
MRSAVIIPFVCCWFGTSSAWAIDCMSAPGNPKTGWYSWREIESRKCWFKKTGATPPKSQLHWAMTVEQEPRSIERVYPSKGRPEPAAEPPPQTDTTNRPESNPPTVTQVKTVRVRPAAAASLRVGNDQVDLMNGTSLLAIRPLGGGARQRPARVAPADPFNARFTGSRN